MRIHKEKTINVTKKKKCTIEIPYLQELTTTAIPMKIMMLGSATSSPAPLFMASACF